MTRYRLALSSALVLAIAYAGWYSLSTWRLTAPQTIAAAAELPAPSLPFIATSTISDVPASPSDTQTGPLSHYIEMVDGCGPYYGGTCVRLRSGPSTSSAVVMPLRDGIVLKVASTTYANGHTWYEIGFDGDVHYPERKTSSWWVSADYTRSFYDVGVTSTTTMDTQTKKRIIVDLANQTLYAYDGDTLFLQSAISTGLLGTPTPLGTFFVRRKMPDSYMQGPTPGSSQYYDLPGVPWDLYFTEQGAAIHGAYWHNHFGERWSHGCVNLPINVAEKLYEWAPLGTPVIVRTDSQTP